MNEEHEMIGKVRTAHRMVLHAREAARELWENKETVLTPARAKEFRNMIREMYEAMTDLGTISGKFEELVSSRSTSL